MLRFTPVFSARVSISAQKDIADIALYTEEPQSLMLHVKVLSLLSCLLPFLTGEYMAFQSAKVWSERRMI